MIKAVIFDMDGVIVDSEPLWREAQIKAFADIGVYMNEDMCRETSGIRTDEVVNYWFSRNNLDLSGASNVVEALHNYTIALIHQKGEPLPGVVEALALFQRMGLPVGLATSSGEIIIDAVMQKLGIQPYFKVLHSAQHEAHGKPHPAVYLSCAEKLGVPPTDCLAIEDTVNGTLAAKAARMTCIAVPDDHSFNNPKFAIADWKLASLTELQKEDVMAAIIG